MRTNYTLPSIPFNSLPIELQEQRLRRREAELIKQQTESDDRGDCPICEHTNKQCTCIIPEQLIGKEYSHE